MAKSKALEGKDVMLFIDGKTIALATSCSLNVTRESSDASSKDDGVWKTDVPGDMSWSANGDSLFAPKEGLDKAQIAYDELFKAMVESKDVAVVFGAVTNPGAGGFPEGGWIAPSTTGYAGNAHVTSLDWTGAKGSAATMTGALTGNGPLAPQAAAMALKTQAAQAGDGETPSDTQSEEEAQA